MVRQAASGLGFRSRFRQIIVHSAQSPAGRTPALQPGERFGFHRHVLDYFWTSVSGGRGRQHLMDGTTVEYSYQPGETRHETYAAGQYKVHDLENIGDAELVFMTPDIADVLILSPASKSTVFCDRCSGLRCGCRADASSPTRSRASSRWAW